eukprot:4883951-Amphidinium_carterae.1
MSKQRMWIVPAYNIPKRRSPDAMALPFLIVMGVPLWGKLLCVLFSSESRRTMRNAECQNARKPTRRFAIGKTPARIQALVASGQELETHSPGAT